MFRYILLILGIWGFLLYPHKIEVKNNSEIQKLWFGKASWYDYKFDKGKVKLCSRSLEDCYTESHRVGASRDFNKGDLVEVCRKNKCVDVLITDWVENESVIIDLSSYAFSFLAPLELGLIDVVVKKK